MTSKYRDDIVHDGEQEQDTTGYNEMVCGVLLDTSSLLMVSSIFVKFTVLC